jgi:hypothetical protein
MMVEINDLERVYTVFLRALSTRYLKPTPPRLAPLSSPASLF